MGPEPSHLHWGRLGMVLAVFVVVAASAVLVMMAVSPDALHGHLTTGGAVASAVVMVIVGAVLLWTCRRLAHVGLFVDDHNLVVRSTAADVRLAGTAVVGARVDHDPGRRPCLVVDVPERDPATIRLARLAYRPADPLAELGEHLRHEIGAGSRPARRHVGRARALTRARGREAHPSHRPVGGLWRDPVNSRVAGRAAGLGPAGRPGGVDKFRSGTGLPRGRRPAD